jgi:hypothetical protein
MRKPSLISAFRNIVGTDAFAQSCRHRCRGCRQLRSRNFRRHRKARPPARRAGFMASCAMTSQPRSGNAVRSKCPLTRERNRLYQSHCEGRRGCDYSLLVAQRLSIRQETGHCSRGQWGPKRNEGIKSLTEVFGWMCLLPRVGLADLESDYRNSRRQVPGQPGQYVGDSKRQNSSGGIHSAFSGQYSSTRRYRRWAGIGGCQYGGRSEQFIHGQLRNIRTGSLHGSRALYRCAARGQQLRLHGGTGYARRGNRSLGHWIRPCKSRRYGWTGSFGSQSARQRRNSDNRRAAGRCRFRGSHRSWISSDQRARAIHQ